MPRSEPDPLVAHSQGPRVFIAGLPSPLTMFVVNLFRELWQEVYGAVAVLAANGADQFAQDAPGAETTIFYADVPDGAIHAQVRALDLPVVFVSDGFAETACFSMIARQMDPLGAVRFVSQSVATLSAFNQSASLAGRIGPQSSLADIFALAEGVMQAGSTTAGVYALTTVQARYAGYARLKDAVDAAVTLAGDLSPDKFCLLPAIATLFAQLGAGYDRMQMPEAEDLACDWPVDVLLSGRPPYSPLDGPIELLGPARVLSFGPYLHLPPGRWSADLSMETHDNLAGNSFMIDVVADGAVAAEMQGEVRNHSAELHARLEFDVTDAKMPIEIRIHLARGAIDGVLSIRSISIERRAIELNNTEYYQT